MEELKEWQTPFGHTAKFFIREGDTNDHAVIDGILDENEYGITNTYHGWGVDVGAHIGGWTIAAALDNPNLYVIALEAVYENVLMLQRNVALNGLEKRVKVLYRAASSANHDVRIKYGFRGSEDARLHRYIGDQRMDDGVDFEIQVVKGLRLTRLLRMLREPIRIMKLDCESCEFQFLRPPEKTAMIEEIVGEYHGPLLREQLPHHDFEEFGTPDLGIFRARLRR